MQRITALLIVLVFLSGCALTTIKAPKKRSSSTPASRPTYHETVYKPKPVPKKALVVEKEEILPAKEEILPMKEEILSLEDSDVK